ncbi:MAG: hypothetical protein K1000chlam2_01518 [Chlamydiae bacterium]|nr:hypothetical protein [Chlamydiota bacterium]
MSLHIYEPLISVYPMNFSIHLRDNPPTYLNMPFTTKAGIELLAWRDIKSVDGKLNIAHRAATETALAVLAFAGLVEATVRTIFAALLCPAHLCKKEGSKLFTNISHGAALCWASIPIFSLIANIFSKTAIFGWSNLWPETKLGKHATLGGRLDRINIEMYRDAYRGKFYQVDVNESGKITRTPAPAPTE